MWGYTYILSFLIYCYVTSECVRERAYLPTTGYWTLAARTHTSHSSHPSICYELVLPCATLKWWNILRWLCYFVSLEIAFTSDVFSVTYFMASVLWVWLYSPKSSLINKFVSLEEYVLIFSFYSSLTFTSIRFTTQILFFSSLLFSSLMHVFPPSLPPFSL